MGRDLITPSCLTAEFPRHVADASNASHLPKGDVDAWRASLRSEYQLDFCPKKRSSETSSLSRSEMISRVRDPSFQLSHVSNEDSSSRFLTTTRKDFSNRAAERDASLPSISRQNLNQHSSLYSTADAESWREDVSTTTFRKDFLRPLPSLGTSRSPGSSNQVGPSYHRATHFSIGLLSEKSDSSEPTLVSETASRYTAHDVKATRKPLEKPSLEVSAHKGMITPSSVEEWKNNLRSITSSSYDAPSTEDLRLAKQPSCHMHGETQRPLQFGMDGNSYHTTHDSQFVAPTSTSAPCKITLRSNDSNMKPMLSGSEWSSLLHTSSEQGLPPRDIRAALQGNQNHKDVIKLMRERHFDLSFPTSTSSRAGGNVDGTNISSHSMSTSRLDFVDLSACVERAKPAISRQDLNRNVPLYSRLDEAEWKQEYSRLSSTKSTYCDPKSCLELQRPTGKVEIVVDRDYHRQAHFNMQNDHDDSSAMLQSEAQQSFVEHSLTDAKRSPMRGKSDTDAFRGVRSSSNIDDWKKCLVSSSRKDFSNYPTSSNGNQRLKNASALVSSTTVKFGNELTEYCTTTDASFQPFQFEAVIELK